MIYFDHNATTPLCQPAREAWLRVQDTLWHNASSLYREAAAARHELEACREQLAELTGTGDPERLIFTGGATEACNGFFRGCGRSLERPSDGKLRVLISPHEHPAVREPAQRWCQAETLRIDPAAPEEKTSFNLHGPPVLAAAGTTTILAWMAAHNETGEIWDPGPEPASASIGSPIIHFCDASQWLGKLPGSAMGRGTRAKAFVVGCAHKLGGPKGVGFLRVGDSPGAEVTGPWQMGGPQEQGWRAGTEDVAGIAAMVAALEWCEDQMPGDPTARDEFEAELGWPVVAGNRPRLWNTSMVVAPRHQNKRWVARLSQRGFPCSTGSACSSGLDADSPALAALGLPADARRRVLRFSSGWTTTPAHWHALRAALHAVMQDLDQAAGPA